MDTWTSGPFTIGDTPTFFLEYLVNSGVFLRIRPLSDHCYISVYVPPLYSSLFHLSIFRAKFIGEEQYELWCEVQIDHFWERTAGHSILNRTVIRIYCPWTRAREENEFGHSFYSATNWEWMRRNLLVKGRLADGAVLSGKLIKYVTALID